MRRIRDSLNNARMANFFKKTIDLGGTVVTVWSFVPAAIQTTITTALSGVTAYFGYQQLGLARCIFYATGVMAFGMTVVFLWARLSQMLGIFHRLFPATVVVPNVSIDVAKGKVNGINTQLILMNTSQQLMFYRLRRANGTYEGVGPKSRDVDQNIIAIAPNNGTQTINFATVQDVSFPSKKEKDRRLAGYLDLELEYGPAVDDLKYLFKYGAEIHVVFNAIPNSKEFRVDAATSLKKLEHSKA